MEIKSDINIIKCAGNCHYYRYSDGRHYCHCPDRVTKGYCFRCGGI